VPVQHFHALEPEDFRHPTRHLGALAQLIPHGALIAAQEPRQVGERHSHCLVRQFVRVAVAAIRIAHEFQAKKEADDSAAFNMSIGRSKLFGVMLPALQLMQ
jgi:hypothetical protein